MEESDCLQVTLKGLIYKTLNCQDMPTTFKYSIFSRLDTLTLANIIINTLGFSMSVLGTD